MNSDNFIIFPQNNEKDDSFLLGHYFSVWFSICAVPYLLVFRELPWFLLFADVGIEEEEYYIWKLVGNPTLVHAISNIL